MKQRTRETRSEELFNEAAGQGLDGQTVCDHYEKIQLCLHRQDKAVSFPVIDSCRIDNGRLIPFSNTHNPLSRDEEQLLSQFVAFVPAAGASSRYSKPLSALLKSIAAKDRTRIKAHLESLATYVPVLPRPVRTLAESPAAIDRLSDRDCEELARSLRVPKAFYPCVAEGLTFLAVKCLEHQQLRGLAGQVFVSPPGCQDDFARRLTAELGELALRTVFCEQGKKLSTIRFTREGEPARDSQGRLSAVPAGHGALIRLFPGIADDFPSCHSLFIRNIDNINGVGSAVHEATLRFLAFHQRILGHVQEIRHLLANADLATAARVAEGLSGCHAAGRTMTSEELAFMAKLGEQDALVLWRLQFMLFQTPVPRRRPATEEEMLAALTSLYQRPVNTLGQVANTGKDVGGSPMLIRNSTHTLTICLELPHVSEADKEQFFMNPAKATHFNPVFVAAELRRDIDAYAGKANNFWLLAQKTWLGQDVCYVESVLYELLGNSELANPVFVEIPRLLFNPHKSLDDAAGRTLANWGLEGHRDQIACHSRQQATQN